MEDINSTIPLVDSDLNTFVRCGSTQISEHRKSCRCQEHASYHSKWMENLVTRAKLLCQPTLRCHVNILTRQERPSLLFAGMGLYNVKLCDRKEINRFIEKILAKITSTITPVQVGFQCDIQIVGIEFGGDDPGPSFSA